MKTPLPLLVLNTQVSSLFNPLSLGRHAGIAALVAASMLGNASAATVSWDVGGTHPTAPVGGSGTWNSTNAYWSNGTSDSAWVAGNIASFGGTIGTVTVSGSLSVGGLNFTQSSGNYTLTGGTLDFGATSGTINYAGSGANVGNYINSSLAGSGGLTLVSNGSSANGTSFFLGGVNTYSGTTIVCGSNSAYDSSKPISVYITSNSALGNSTSVVTTGSGSSFYLGNGTNTTANIDIEGVTLNNYTSTGYFYGNVASGYSSTWGGDIVMYANLAIRSSIANASLYLNGAITNGTTGAMELTLCTGGATHNSSIVVNGAIGNGTSGGTTRVQIQRTGGTGDGTAGVIYLNADNSYTGSTTILQGIVNVAKWANGDSTSSLGASSSAASNLIISGNYVGGVGNYSATLQYTGATAQSTDRLFTIGNGVNTTSGVASSSSNQVPVLLYATIDASGSTGATLSFTNTGALAYAGTLTGSYGNYSALGLIGSNTGDNVFNPALKDAATTNPTSLIKDGVGTWVIGGLNTYTGTTNINDGTLKFSTVGSGATVQNLGEGTAVNLGVSGSSTTPTLVYTGAGGTMDKNFYALGSGLNTIKNGGTGLLTLSGSLVKNGTILVLNGGANGIKVTGIISGAGANSDLYVTGGPTTLSAINTYNGPTWVYGGGTLINGVTDALPTNTTVVLGGTNGGTDNSSNSYDLNGYNQTVAGLTGTGSGVQTVTNNSAGTTATLTITGGGAFGGVIADGNGTTALKVSGGTLVLGGINTYTGATSITGGTLSVNGSISASSVVSISEGATLSGSGTVGGTVTATSATINGSGLNIGATTLTGSSTLSGTTSSNGALTVASGTTYLTAGSRTTAPSLNIQGTLTNQGGTISGPTTVSGALTGHGTVNGALTISAGGVLAALSSGDVQTVTGLLNIETDGKVSAIIDGGAAGTYSTIVAESGVSIANGTTLFITLNTPLNVGNFITLINNEAASNIDGAFTQVTLNNNTYTVNGNGTFTDTIANVEYLLNYKAVESGDSYANDLTLTVVPEPTTWALLVGGVGLLVGLQRVRRNA